MSKALEMALRLFSPKGAHLDLTYGNFNALRRDDLIGALHMAAKDNLLGLQYLLADHLVDLQAISELQAYFTTTLGNDDTGAMALAILLRKPLPEQLERLVLSHPYYDRERRRAAVVKEKAKRAHRSGNEHEYQRLRDESNALLSAAHGRCVDEILQTGRCPQCAGTGRRVRIGGECPQCHGTGRVTPDIELVSRRLGVETQRLVEQMVDEVICQASDLTRRMEHLVRKMRDA